MSLADIHAEVAIHMCEINGIAFSFPMREQLLIPWHATTIIYTVIDIYMLWLIYCGDVVNMTILFISWITV